MFQEESYPFELSQILRLSADSFSAAADGAGADTYSRKQGLLLEKLVLSTLKFDLCPPTSLFFMETLATHKLTGCLYDTTLMDCIE